MAAPVVALEIGTSKIIALVGELREGGSIMITGMGMHPSAGVRKGEVVDLANAGVCLRAALGGAEESGRVSIRQVHLAVSAGHIHGMVNRGVMPVMGGNGEITREDVEQVMEIARAVNLPPDRDILHTICRHFRVDDHDRVIAPEGMEGARLAVDMLVLHLVRNRLRNTIKVIENVGVGIQDVAFGGLCSALAVLTPEQKQSGAVVIDLGGGTTDYAAYADNVIATAGSLGVGGDHVSNDVAVAFNIPLTHAERIKQELASAVAGQSNRTQKISVPPDVGFRGRSIGLDRLDAVVNARMDEIFGMIRSRLEEDVLHGAAAGIILTGGGAHMKRVSDLAEEVFELPCCVGKPRNVSGLAVATEGPEYAACVGMVQYGFRSVSSRAGRGGFAGFLKSLLGG